MQLKYYIYACVLVVLIICILLNNKYELFSVNFSKAPKGEFSVLSYNIHSTGQNFETDAPQIANPIIENNPDFIYLTEYYESKGDTIDKMLSQHYPHKCTKHRWGLNEGDVFYSKWKIDSVARFYLNGERIMAYRVQVSHKRDTVVLYCCHLASNNIADKTTTWESIKKGYRKRGLEVEELLKHIISEKYPIIMMGDMNDISGSPALNRIEEIGFKDAWWNGGMGYGSTFRSGWLNLRIDHILYDNNFQLCGIRVIHADYSDHDALLGTFKIKRIQ